MSCNQDSSVMGIWKDFKLPTLPSGYSPGYERVESSPCVCLWVCTHARTAYTHTCITVYNLRTHTCIAISLIPENYYVLGDIENKGRLYIVIYSRYTSPYI